MINQRLLVFIQGEWHNVDLPEENISINIQFNDLAELSDRQASYSQNISLPLTENNARVFEFLHLPQTQSTLPYGYSAIRLYINDVLQFGGGGFLKVVSTSKDKINVQVLSSLGDVFTLLKNISLKNLSPTALGWIYHNTSEQWEDNFSYSYPTDFVRIKKRPAIVGKDLETYETKKGYAYYANYYDVVAKIFQLLGYAFYTDITSTEQDKDYLLLGSLNADEGNSARELSWEKEESFLQVKWLTSGNNNLIRPLLLDETQDDATLHLGFAGAPFYVPSSSDANSYSSWAECVNMVRHKVFTCDFAGVVHVKVSFSLATIRWDHYYRDAYVFLSLCVNGENKKQRNLRVRNTTLYNKTLTIEEDLEVSSGDKISFGVFADLPKRVNLINNTQLLATGVKFSYEINIVSCSEVPEGGRLFLKDNLQQGTTLNDIVKVFANIYGLTFHVEETEKKVYAYTMKTLYSNKDNALDLTDKLIKNGERNQTFTLSSYAQSNRIFFKDNDYATDEAFFIVENTTLSDSKDAVNLSLNAGADVEESDSVLPLIPMMEKSDNSWNYKGTSEQLVEIREFSNNIFFAKHLRAEYLLQTFYKELCFSMLRKVQCLEVEVLLDVETVAELSPYVPVYLREEGAYYYLNKLSNFQLGKTCKISLVRL